MGRSVLAGAWQVELPPPTVESDDARAAAEDVLRQDDYGEASNLLLDAVVWLLEQITRPLESLGGGGWATVAGWLVLGALVAGSATLAVRATRGIARDRAVHPVTAAGPADPDEWRRAATAARSRGDHTEAVRCEHRVVELEMERRGLIEPRRGRTAGELQRAMATAVPAAGDLAGELRSLFDRARYGSGATPADSNRAAEVRAGIEAAVR